MRRLVLPIALGVLFPVLLSSQAPKPTTTTLTASSNGSPEGTPVTFLANASPSLTPVSYQLATTLPVPVRYPYGAFVAIDFNRDGHKDLFLTDDNSGVALVFYGDGQGGFGAPQSIDMGSGLWPYALEVFAGNFDQDADDELLIWEGGTDLLTCDPLINESEWTWCDPNTVTWAPIPAGMPIPFVDHNGDRVPDQKRTFSISDDWIGDRITDTYAGQTGGSLALDAGNQWAQPIGGLPKTMGSVGGPLTWAESADLNRDGFSDLVLSGETDHGTGFVTIAVWRPEWSVAPSFRPPHFDFLHLPGRLSAVRDFNRDGILDIATTSDGRWSAPAPAAIWLGDGEGQFTETRPWGDSGATATADFNGDGRPDVAGLTVNLITGAASIGIFTEPSPAGVTPTFGAEITTTLDGPAVAMALTQSASDLGPYEWYSNRPAPDLAVVQQNVVGQSTTHRDTFSLLGWGDGRGRFDVAASINTHHPQNGWGSGIWMPDLFLRAPYLINDPTATFEYLDADGDALLDVCLWSRSIGFECWTGDRIYGPWTGVGSWTQLVFPILPRNGKLGRLDRDGMVDVVAFVAAGDLLGNTRVSFGKNDWNAPVYRSLFRRGNASLPCSAFATAFALNLQPTATTIADLDGDGLGDVVIAEGGGLKMLSRPQIATGGTVCNLAGGPSGLGSTSVVLFDAPRVLATLVAPATALTTAMIDGDRLPDVVISESDVRVYSSATGTVTDLNIGIVNSFAVGDFNNDGIPDIAMLKDDSLHLRVGGGTAANGQLIFTAVAPRVVGSSPKLLTSGDVDLDGALDLIFASDGAASDYVSVILNTTPYAGSIEFFADGQSLGTVAARRGAASLTTSALTFGSHSIQAVFSGNEHFAGSSRTITHQVTAAPTAITTHPANATACLGVNASFSVAATGTALTYQWRYNGAVIDGATEPVLMVTASASTIGSYDVIVTGANGTVTSNKATLALAPGPAIVSAPVDFTAVFGSSASFMASASAAAGASVAWQWEESLDGLVFTPIAGAAGSGEVATLTLEQVARAMSGRRYRAVFTGCGVTATTAATLTVNKATAMLIVPDADAIYSATPHAAIATTEPPGLSGVTFTYNGSPQAPIAAGVYTVVAHLANNDYAAADVSATLTIARAPLTISVADVRRIYGHATPAFEVTYLGLVGGETRETAGAPVTVTTTASETSVPGDYPIALDGGPVANYAITFDDGTLSIDKAPLIVAAEQATRPYGMPNPPFTASYAGFVLGQGAAILEGTLQFTTAATLESNAGQYAVTPSGLSSSLYDITFEPGTLIVTARELTVVVPSTSKTYGQPNPPFDPNDVVFEGFVLGQNRSVLTGNIEFLTTATAASPVGPVAVTASGLNGAPNYVLTYQPGVLQIEPAPLVVRANDVTTTFGGVVPPFTVSYAGFVLGQDQSVLGGLLQFTPNSNDAFEAGDHPITPSGLNAANYAIEYQSGTLTVTRRPLVITAVDASRPYASPNPGFAVTYAGFIDGDGPAGTLTGALTFTTLADQDSHTGDYAVTPGGVTAGNYAVEFAPGTLTITPRPLTVFANDATRPYGQPNPAFSIGFSGFVNHETAAVVSGTPTFTTADQLSPVGSYDIMPGGLSAQDYAISYEPGTLTITMAATQLAWADPPAIKYPAALDASQLNATANVDGSFAYSIAAGSTLAPGCTLTTATFTPADTLNYMGGTVTANICVVRGTQTIEWPAPAAIDYGTALSAAQLNATAQVAGAQPAGALTYSPAAGVRLEGGRRTLRVTAAATAYYESATLEVEIDVLPVDQLITWTDPAPIQYGTPLTSVQKNAVVSVGGPAPHGEVTYTPSSMWLDAGLRTLTVTAAATHNYKAASKSVQIQVNKAPLLLASYNGYAFRMFYDAPTVTPFDFVSGMSPNDQFLFTVGMTSNLPIGTPAGAYQPMIVFNDPLGRAVNYIPTTHELFYIYNPPIAVSSIDRLSAVKGSGDTTITISGDGFVPSCGASCPPPVCPTCTIDTVGTFVHWNGTALPVTFVSRTEVRASIPAALLTSTGVAYLSIGQERSASVLREFFITDAPTTVEDAATGTGTGDPLHVEAGSTGPEPETLFADTPGGEGTVTIATYESNPGSAFAGGDHFFDVFVANGSTFPSLTVTTCELTSPADRIFWFNGTSWIEASHQTAIAGPPACVQVLIDHTTSPSLSQLTGTFFAALSVSTAGKMNGEGHLETGGVRYGFEFKIADRPPRGEKGHFKLDTRQRGKEDKFTSDDITAVRFGTDAVTFTGTGRFNGKAGYQFEVEAADRGEPGKNRDTIRIVIKDAAGRAIVTVSGIISGGNIQSHR